MLLITADGRIAQLGEHLPYKQGVTGSSPVSPTIFILNLINEVVLEVLFLTSYILLLN